MQVRSGYKITYGYEVLTHSPKIMELKIQQLSSYWRKRVPPETGSLRVAPGAWRGETLPICDTVLYKVNNYE